MKPLLATIAALTVVWPLHAAGPPAHLFLLSGQSNMAGLKPEISFTPAVGAAFGKDKVVVVKSAQSGAPIRQWYKKWKPATGPAPEDTGKNYDLLMKKVNAAIEDRKIATVTFLWMQGERDGKTGHGEVYAASLEGLVAQLREDMGRPDLNFVIGRISDHRNGETMPHWEMVRKAQVAVADADPRGAWVDTDDLNGEKDGLHYSKPGYKTLGERFAREAVALVKAAESPSRETGKP